MKAVFVGGGAHRLVPILRGAMAERRIFDGGEIHLHDLDVKRAEAVGRILRQTPEYRRIRCGITWGGDLEKALEGADAVGVILRAGSPLAFELGAAACWSRGFVSSDNLSPSGAILGIKGVPILLDLARKMEARCPNAVLVDFANPIAVLSAAVNRHTKIKAVGVCQGFTNHRWDLNRLLGRDAEGRDFDVETVGVNHLSFIVRGSMGGKDIFPLLDRALAKGVPRFEFQPFWSKIARKNILRSIRNLTRFYREMGILVFSTEEDGMWHLYHDEAVREHAASIPTRRQIQRGLRRQKNKRAMENAFFQSHAGRALSPAFWRQADVHGPFGRDDADIFVQILKGMSGRKADIVVSKANEGAILGLPMDVVVEASFSLQRRTISPIGPRRVPPVVHGLVSGLAMHQTLLADAVATDDPKLLANALLSYPVNAYTSQARDLYRELLKINADELPASLRGAGDFLKTSF